jgi:hypothetical protein
MNAYFNILQELAIMKGARWDSTTEDNNNNTNGNKKGRAVVQ